MDKIITAEYLKEHPNHIFVFGDNTLRIGKGGAAILRDIPNTYGFITKRYPNTDNKSYYTVKEYESLYRVELEFLEYEIVNNPDKVYLISKLGAGLANRYGIFEQVIEPTIKQALQEYPNVEFLW